MIIDELSKTAANGVSIQVGLDETWHCSPRDWDNLSILCLRPHRNYDHPQEAKGFDWANYDNADDAAKALERDHGARNIVAVWMYDHSSVAYKAGDRTYPFTCEWDGSFAGFAFTTDEQIQMMGTPDDRIDSVIADEVDTYSMWANGECYYYSIDTPDGKGADGCGGFIGWDDIESQSKDAFDAAVKDYDERKAKEDTEREHWAARDVMTV